MTVTMCHRPRTVAKVTVPLPGPVTLLRSSVIVTSAVAPSGSMPSLGDAVSRSVEDWVPQIVACPVDLTRTVADERPPPRLIRFGRTVNRVGSGGRGDSLRIRSGPSPVEPAPESERVAVGVGVGAGLLAVGEGTGAPAV